MAISVPAIAQGRIHAPIRDRSTIPGCALRKQKQPSYPALNSFYEMGNCSVHFLITGYLQYLLFILNGLQHSGIVMLPDDMS